MHSAPNIRARKQRSLARSRRIKYSSGIHNPAVSRTMINGNGRVVSETRVVGAEDVVVSGDDTVVVDTSEEPYGVPTFVPTTRTAARGSKDGMIIAGVLLGESTNSDLTAWLS